MHSTNLPGWEIKALEDGIYIEMPYVIPLKRIRDSLPEILGANVADIDVPKSCLKFHFRYGYENFEGVLNPHEEDLNEE